MLNAKVTTVRLEKDMSVPSLLKRTWQRDLALQSHTCKNHKTSVTMFFRQKDQSRDLWQKLHSNCLHGGGGVMI